MVGIVKSEVVVSAVKVVSELETGTGTVEETPEIAAEARSGTISETRSGTIAKVEVEMVLGGTEPVKGVEMEAFRSGGATEILLLDRSFIVL